MSKDWFRGTMASGAATTSRDERPSAISGVTRAISGPPSRPLSGFVPAARESSPESGPHSRRGGATGPRVLLVEDDHVTRAKLEQILVRRGAEVLSAAGPGEAIYLLQTLEESARPFMTILDVLMPGLDGPLFVQMLRGDPRLAGAPVVLISALSAPALEQTMRDWRADGFILKSRGLLHVDQAFEAWLDRISNRISGVPSRRSGSPSSSSAG